MQISTARHSVRGFLLKRRIFLPSLLTLAGGRGDRGGKDERDNWCPPPGAQAAITLTRRTDVVTRTRPQTRGDCSYRCLRLATVCEAPGAGKGPSVRQAETSGALPCGFGSHSHPSAAKIWPFPALQQKPSAPTLCHQVRTQGPRARGGGAHCGASRTRAQPVSAQEGR